MTTGSTTHASPGGEELERQAVAWIVRLQTQSPNARLQRACDHWRRTSPAHEQAWQAVQHSYGLIRRSFQRLPAAESAAAMHALQQVAGPGGRRKALGRLAALALVAAPTAWLAQRHLPWQRLGADYATVTGERHDLTLPDGTRLFLNTDSAVRVRFDAVQRLLLLDRGEIFVRSGPDPASAARRPLRVQTAQGLLEALGTSFSVRLLPGRKPPASRLGVEEGAVRVQPRRPPPGLPVVAKAGQSWLMTDAAVIPDTPAGLDIHSWTDGLLVVQDMRLADFLAEVARYRPGHLGWDDDVAGLRISGTYPLGDTTRLLALLSESLPVETVLRTRYWAQVRRARADRRNPAR